MCFWILFNFNNGNELETEFWFSLLLFKKDILDNSFSWWFLSGKDIEEKLGIEIIPLGDI